MDFEFSDEQQSIADLAQQILRDGCSKERLKAALGEFDKAFVAG